MNITVYYTKSPTGNADIWYRGPNLEHAMLAVKLIKAKSSYGVGDVLHVSAYDRQEDSQITLMFKDNS